jgi:hypothetical protein
MKNKKLIIVEGLGLEGISYDQGSVQFLFEKKRPKKQIKDHTLKEIKAEKCWEDIFLESGLSEEESDDLCLFTEEITNLFQIKLTKEFKKRLEQNSICDDKTLLDMSNKFISKANKLFSELVVEYILGDDGIWRCVDAYCVGYANTKCLISDNSD